MSSVTPLIPAVDPLAAKSLTDRVAERVAKLRLVTWTLVNIGGKVDPILMRLSGGRASLAGGGRVVVLRTQGAKSGLWRETPLVYFTDGANVILIASKGGAPTHPAWLHNLRANPDVELWVGPRGGKHKAREANPSERADLWAKAVALYDGYAKYQELAGAREIPVVICEPLEQGNEGH